MLLTNYFKIFTSWQSLLIQPRFIFLASYICCGHYLFVRTYIWISCSTCRIQELRVMPTNVKVPPHDISTEQLERKDSYIFGFHAVCRIGKIVQTDIKVPHEIRNARAALKKRQPEHHSYFCFHIFISCSTSACWIQDGRYCIPISKFTRSKNARYFQIVGARQIHLIC